MSEKSSQESTPRASLRPGSGSPVWQEVGEQISFAIPTMPKSDGSAELAQLLQQVKEMNSQGLDRLRLGNAMEALVMLTEAQEMLARPAEDALQVHGSAGEERRAMIAAAQAETASNQGICHKRMGGTVAAVKALQKALKLYNMAGTDLRSLVASHLNLSACFLDAKVADQALGHAQAAVDLCGRLVAGSQPGASVMHGSSRADEPLVVTADDYAMLAVAYHKIGEAHEGLKDWQAACFAYTQAYEVVRRSLGPDHKLTKSFETSSRCPRKSKIPEVPNIFQSNLKPPRRRLPEVPHIFSGRPKTMQWTPGKDYHLDVKKFPSWPPKGCSAEEQQWYKMAEQHRQRERAQEVASMAPHGLDFSQVGSSAFPRALSSR
eukprot:TRINITY_DN111372_c0_g1_i1.p1 TRINITY_DN111372_c0_g1~~TRINITY_DN111372_c0_g1_i1.p1  ORF type:complete len:377 (-),score=105.78 TRINITY_DN111372_c0_g1_i1:84-1214(-)